MKEWFTTVGWSWGSQRQEQGEAITPLKKQGEEVVLQSQGRGTTVEEHRQLPPKM